MSLSLPPPAPDTAARRRGFTLLELLMALGLITLLAGLLFVSLRGVRQGADRIDSLSSLREMMQGYSAYAADHRQRLMPGYLDEADLQQLGITARLGEGTVLSACAAGRCDAGPYVWRLAPYMDQAWATVMRDYPDTSTMSRLNQELASGVYGPGSASAVELGIAAVPSFGLNSIFVGGDSLHGGPAAAGYVPWRNGASAETAATRISAVRSPAQLIVFAPAARAATGAPATPDAMPYRTDERYGYGELRPPFLTLAGSAWSGQQWKATGRGTVQRVSGGEFDPAGLPICRHGDDRYPVANLDGSTTVESLIELALPSSMRRWSPLAP